MPSIEPSRACRNEPQCGLSSGVEPLAFLADRPVLLQVCHHPIEVVLLRDAQLIAELGDVDAGFLASARERLLAARPAGATGAAPPAVAAGSAGAAARASRRAAGAAPAWLVHARERF